MKVPILIACGVVATCACASNSNPPDDPTHIASVPTAGTTATNADAWSEQNRSVMPAHTEPSSAPAAPSMPSGAATDSSASDTSNATATIPPPPPAAQPDNTRVNQRDRGSDAMPTPMDQGNGSSDLKITQQIRQAVMADGSLSFTAKNVKIITQNGKVTLRGPVKTDLERSAIETSARKVAGDTNVDNQLEVKK